MGEQVFVIKHLWIQNSVMLLALGLLLFFVLYSVLRKKPRHLLAAIIWLAIVLWFFNSPFFGFSTVAVSHGGIKVNYGILSVRNDVLPITAPWKIISNPSGIRKLKRVHFIRIGNHDSMKVRGVRDLNLLKEIGATIDEYRDLS